MKFTVEIRKWVEVEIDDNWNKEDWLTSFSEVMFPVDSPEEIVEHVLHNHLNGFDEVECVGKIGEDIKIKDCGIDFDIEELL
jgi:hypothetical protein